MKDVITDIPRMHMRTGFKLGDPPCVTTVQGQKVKRQGHVTYRQTEHFNSAVYGLINFKLGGNYRRQSGRVWYTF